MWRIVHHLPRGAYKFTITTLIRPVFMPVLVCVYRGSNWGPELTLVAAVKVGTILVDNVIVISFRGLTYGWFEHTRFRWYLWRFYLGVCKIDMNRAI